MGGWEYPSRPLIINMLSYVNFVQAGFIRACAYTSLRWHLLNKTVHSQEDGQNLVLRHNGGFLAALQYRFSTYKQSLHKKTNIIQKM
jgi:hypothetical protein